MTDLMTSLRREPVRHMDLNLKVTIGRVVFNVLYINFEPATPAWHFRNHSHSSYELHVIPRGQGVLRLADRELPIAPGVMYLTGPGVYHQQRADEEDPMCEYCINFEFDISARRKKKTDAYIESEVNDILATLRNTRFWFGRDAFDTISLFERIFEELSNVRLGYYAYVQNLASQIIIHAVRSFSDNERNPGDCFPRKILDDRRRFVADNYFKDCHLPLSAAELAGLIGVSVRQLDRIMRQYYRKSFTEKLHEARLSLAMDLLAKTGLTAREIAEASGFSSAPYFCKVFKRHTDMTPSEYRRSRHDIPDVRP